MKQESIVKSEKEFNHLIYEKAIELKIFSKVMVEFIKNTKSNSFEIDKNELLENFKGSNDGFKELKNVVINMFHIDGMSSVIFLEIASIDDKVVFVINEKVKPFLLKMIKNLNEDFFNNISNLKSAFSINIYELLKQYEKTGTVQISLIELKSFMNIEDGEFSKYNDFKEFVILVAQKELKEKTDICFEFEEIKQGRKVEKINFIVLQN